MYSLLRRKAKPLISLLVKARLVEGPAIPVRAARAERRPGLLDSAALRDGITVAAVVEDFRMYMDYFNLRFKDVLAGIHSPEQALREHEERCHRQLGILLYGVLGDRDENR